MSALEKGVSIVICTYNGKKNLAPTLEHIAAQKNVASIPVELLIIDNASTDNTTAFAQEKWKTLNSSIPLRIIQEPQSGKAYASRKGFNAAKHEFILVCDDDNWLCDSYVQHAYEIMTANPSIGVLGGTGIPVFEKQKPEWFDKYEVVFAVGKQGGGSGDVTDKVNALWGAGMVFRKEAWNKLNELNYRFFLNAQRTGKTNWGGDDSELCEMIRMLGYRIWVEDDLTFKHYMPQNRMTAAYIKSRFYGLGRSRLYLQAYMHCRTHKTMPGQHLNYPLWFDKWIFRTKDYLKQLPNYIFYKDEKLDDEHLKFLALKGEIAELWRIKNKYTDVFSYILGMQEKINLLKK